MPVGVRAGAAGEPADKESEEICDHFSSPIFFSCSYRVDSLGAIVIID